MNTQTSTSPQPSTPTHRSASFQSSTPTLIPHAIETRGEKSPSAATSDVTQKRALSEILNELDEKAARRRRRKRGEGLSATYAFEQAARWFPRSVDPFISITKLFRVGLACDVDNPDDPTALIVENDAVVADMSSAERLRYVNGYNALMASAPGLRDFIFTLTEDPAGLQRIITSMDTVARNCRSDDTTALKTAGPRYILAAVPPPDLDNVQIFITAEAKSSRGFNNPHYGRLLCPHRYSQEYQNDPERMCQRFLQGELEVTSADCPAFLYDRAYNPDQRDDGLLRGPICVRVYQHLFTGPASARQESSRSHTRKCQAAIHGLLRTTPRTIAYAAVQARHMMSVQGEWSIMDDAFDNQTFFLHLVRLFEADPDSLWARDTLDWWDMQVFKKRPRGDIGDPTNITPQEAATRAADENSDFQVLLTQRGTRPPSVVAAN